MRTNPMRGLSRRSRTKWVVRIALALLVAVVGYVGVAHSLSLAVEDRDPARAHALFPGNGSATAQLARAIFSDRQEAGANSEPATLARLALRQDPTVIQAVTTLGFQAQLRGELPAARRLFAYAQQLSRRDLQTQLWAIEEAIRRDDVPGALHQYDTALRTSKVAPEILFPILAAAIAEPAVRRSLVATLARDPAWSALFIRYVADNAADPADVVDLYTGLRRAGLALSSDATTVAVNRLVAAGSLDAAWRYYASLRPGADRRRSRDPRFLADLATPSVLDWSPANDQSIATSIQRGPRGGVFDFAAPPTTGGVLLRQVQLLPPGAYRLGGRSDGIEQPAGSLPYWRLSCADGRELGQVVVPPSARAGGRFTGRFSVPLGCPVQTLSLVARPSDELSGVTGQIAAVQLVPVAARP
jgi:hypothetical protein